MTNIKPNPATSSRNHLWEQVAVVIEDAVRSWSINVRHDITRLQKLKNVPKRRHCVTYVHHHRQIKRCHDGLCTTYYLKVVCTRHGS